MSSWPCCRGAAVPGRRRTRDGQMATTPLCPTSRPPSRRSRVRNSPPADSGPEHGLNWHERGQFGLWDPPAGGMGPPAFTLGGGCPCAAIRAGCDERTRLRFSRTSIARCADLIPFLRVCLEPSRHCQDTTPREHAPWAEVPAHRTFAPAAQFLPAPADFWRVSQGPKPAAWMIVRWLSCRMFIGAEIPLTICFNDAQARLAQEAIQTFTNHIGTAVMRPAARNSRTNRARPGPGTEVAARGRISGSGQRGGPGDR